MIDASVTSWQELTVSVTGQELTELEVEDSVYQRDQYTANSAYQRLMCELDVLNASPPRRTPAVDKLAR